MKPGRMQVTFDCRDPAAQGRFWARLLGYPEPDVTGWHDFLRSQGRPDAELNQTFALDDPEGLRPRLFFQRVPEPKTAKNRLHLDITAPSDVPGERRAQIDGFAEALTSYGARVVGSVSDDGGYFVVMADPEGNEFCID
jgi:catechol 2,3-dioxygenase-like lactoylglutathione lyase family enzyme